MAISKSSSKKKRNEAAKAATKQKRVLETSSPIKVVIEILVKTESAAASIIQPNFFKALTLAEAAVGDCPDNHFKYSFDKTNDVTVLSLAVGGFKQDMPGDSGEFTTCILDPNDPPSITVVVVARKNNPSGRAAISLSLNDKPVYSTPREIDDKGQGVLGIMESVKLPV